MDTLNTLTQFPTSANTDILVHKYILGIYVYMYMRKRTLRRRNSRLRIPRLGERTIERSRHRKHYRDEGRGEKDGVVEKQKKTVKCVEGERCLGFLPVATV